MYRHKLTSSQPKSTTAAQLRDLLLSYHDFRAIRDQHPLGERFRQVQAFQSARLKRTHQSLYQDPRYHRGLDFLMEDLYAPQQFTRRDDDIDRLYPMMVKLLPEPVLALVARLVELNLLTQELDLALASLLPDVAGPITDDTYITGYRACGRYADRRHQIQLIADIGDDLDRYVRSRTLGFLLRMSQGAAEMAGLGDLHGFLRRGFDAFLEMDGVDSLLDIVVEREVNILAALESGHPDPLGV